MIPTNIRNILLAQQMDVEEYETDQNQANRPMVTTKGEIEQNI